MKKQMITIAILSAVVCLTGCSININDETMSQAVNHASSVQDDTENKVSTQAVSAASGTGSDVTAVQTAAAVSGDHAAPRQTTTAVNNAKAEPNSFGFYRVTEMPPTGISVAALEGEWYNNKTPDRILTFYDCGLYGGSYTLNDCGKVTEGKVYLEYNIYPDETKVFWYNLYENDNSYPMSLGANDTIPLSALYPLEQDSGYYIRNEAAENPFDEYVGHWQSETQWNGSDFDIQISKSGDLMKVVVSSHSAVADYEWDYTCTCSDDGTYIACLGSGILNRTDHAPNGDILDPVVVFNDGTAQFNIKGGVLFWQECKEDTARQVGFRKIG